MAAARGGASSGESPVPATGESAVFVSKSEKRDAFVG